ncbi:MAG: hypothetical protein ACTSQY_04035 [Candidatus Odinarchaeia archaeon]
MTSISKKLGVKIKRKSVDFYLRLQGRFSHLSDRDIQSIQKFVDKRWEMLINLDQVQDQ